VVRCTLVAPVRSRGGTGQGVISGDAPRRRHDDRAEEAARGGGVPAVGGGLGVLRLEMEARGRLLVRRSGERRNGLGGGGRNLAGGRRLHFKGERQGGGPGGVGAAWRSGGEREGESGFGRGVARPRRAWAARCRVIVEGSEVDATRDGAADRWAGMSRAPIISG
jgi:hypothetical protein